jgi:chromate transporter
VQANRRNPAGTGSSRRGVLRELALLFLKLGTIAFGGPAAHIAMMEDEVVTRRRWLTRQDFLDLVGATNLIPGPNSTELAIHVGHRRAGFAGLVVAGVSFILPAALIVGVFAWMYVRFGSLPAAEGVLYGVKPVVIAVVAQAVWRLGRDAVKTTFLAAIAVAAATAVFLGLHELAVLALAAAAALLAPARRLERSARLAMPVPLAPLLPAAAAPAAMGAALGPIFLVFLKIGSVLFGSGYVLLAFLQSELVERRHWIDSTQLLDATAVGQVTPGPVFTTATFIGYLLAGPEGALAATLGIFLPAFVFVAASAPFIPRLRRSPLAARALDGLNVGSLALMAVVTARLGTDAIRDLWTGALALVAAVLLFRYRINSAWLILAGAAMGLILEAAR